MSRKAIILVTLCVAAITLRPAEAEAQNMAISTNILEWGLISPNLEFALVTGEKSSIHLGAMYSNHPYNLDFGAVVINPEYRYWLKGRPFSRLYVGGAADLVAYNRTALDGRAFAIGPTAGYDIVLGNNWSIDFSIGAGAAYFRQQAKDAEASIKTSGITVAPIKAGVSIVYIIR